MTDIDSLDETADRLRRVLATKANDLGPGDGAEWSEVQLARLTDQPGRPPAKPLVRLLTVGAAVLVVVAAGVFTTLHRPDSVSVTDNAGSDIADSRPPFPSGLPFLTFDEGLVPGAAPLTPWATRPTISGFMEYHDLLFPDGSRQPFRHVGFDQKLAADGSTIPTATLVLTGATSEQFAPSTIMGILECSAELQVRGHPTVVGKDPVTGSIVLVWREQPDIAAVLMITGYRLDDAVALADHLVVVTAQQWSSFLEGLSSKNSSSSDTASRSSQVWTQYERFRHGQGNYSGPPTTTLVASGIPCR